MKRFLTVVAGVAVLGAMDSVQPVDAVAQDVELLSERVGIPLPDAYYEEKARNPLAFELPNGLFGRRTNLPPVRAPGLVPQRNVTPFYGTARFPVVLALFADSEDPVVTPEQIEQSLFTGPAPKGTLTEFYTEASYGQFTVQGDVLPWVRTSITMADAVGTSYGLGGNARVGEYLIDALSQLDAQVDFTQYDNDGPDGIPNSGDDDGIVDVVTFEFQEGAASCGGPAIWPHRWGLSGWTEDDQPWDTGDMGASGQPIQVDGYIIQGATNCGGDQVQIAATIAHEFGHVLGLPDYYHPVGGITPENRRWVLGCWELMAAGAWGCGPVGATRSAFGPTHMTAWNRYRMGWLDFQDVGTVRDSTFTLDPIRTTGQVLRIPLEDDVQGPVLLVEYRDHEGFDADTPAEGVLVVRIDPDGELRPRTGFRYFASLLEADDDSGLLEVLAEGGDRGAATDVFGRPGHTRLNGMTSPSTRSPGGVPNGVAFHEIAFAGGQATIRLSTDREPEIEEASGDLTGRAGRPLELEFQISGGIMPYAPRFDLSGGASLTSPPTEVSTLAGLQVTADQDRLRITGAPLVDGPVRLPIVVDDLLGNRDYVEYTLMVDPFEPVFADLAAALLGASGGLTQSELDLLDYQGNGNQILDVGDLRAWRYRGSN